MARTHGKSYSREYKSWQSMKERCFNPNCHAYADYGGRGIKICTRWLTFENFYADMGNRPSGTTLDRINNNGDYSPDNCRWADSKTQNTNQRAPKTSKPANLIDPEGSDILIAPGMINRFCMDNGLCAGHLYAVLRGKRGQHKGWSGKYL